MEAIIVFYFAKPNVALQRQFFWTIWSTKLCHTDMDYSKLVFRDFSAKQNIKKHRLFCNLINFLAMKKTHSPNGRVICDLHSPDTFDTRLGERASANVQPCVSYPLFGFGDDMVYHCSLSSFADSLLLIQSIHFLHLLNDIKK